MHMVCRCGVTRFARRSPSRLWWMDVINAKYSRPMTIMQRQRIFDAMRSLGAPFCNTDRIFNPVSTVVHEIQTIQVQKQLQCVVCSSHQNYISLDDICLNPQIPGIGQEISVVGRNLPCASARQEFSSRVRRSVMSAGYAGLDTNLRR